MKPKKASKKVTKPKKKDKFAYPAKEDIYSQEEKAEDINPDDFSVIKKGGKKKPAKWNEQDFDHDHTGDDLDIPGAELDDEEEEEGREDEENNYYSLGDNK